MIKRDVPKDIRSYKTKIIGSFTGRQLLCTSIAGVLVAFLYFAILNPLGVPKTVSIVVCSLVAMIPMSFMFSINDMPMETYLHSVIRWNMVAPSKRKIDVVIYEPDVEKPDPKAIKKIQKEMKKKKKKQPENPDLEAFW